MVHVALHVYPLSHSTRAAVAPWSVPSSSSAAGRMWGDGREDERVRAQNEDSQVENATSEILNDKII